jgi:hypothetical protein
VTEEMCRSTVKPDEVGGEEEEEEEEEEEAWRSGCGVLLYLTLKLKQATASGDEESLS